jgi:hypothetical protein
MNRRKVNKLASHLELSQYDEAAEDLPFDEDEVKALDAFFYVLQRRVFDRDDPTARAIAIQALADHTELDDFFYERILDKAGDDRE